MKPFNLEAAKNGADVVTGNGNKVRIICFDVADPNYPLAALVLENDGIESLDGYTDDGAYRCGSVGDCDLFMAPIKKECWINFYGVLVDVDVYTSEELANGNARSGRISCIHHTWEE